MLVYGVLNFGLSYALIYFGLVHASAGTGQLTLALVPLLTLGLAIAHGVERFRWVAFAGALIALAGMVLIFVEQLSLDIPLVALASLVGSAIVVAEVGVAVKWFPSVHPVAQNAIGMGVGAALLAVLSLRRR